MLEGKRCKISGSGATFVMALVSIQMGSGKVMAAWGEIVRIEQAARIVRDKIDKW